MVEDSINSSATSSTYCNRSMVQIRWFIAFRSYGLWYDIALIFFTKDVHFFGSDFSYFFDRSNHRSPTSSADAGAPDVA